MKMQKKSKKGLGCLGTIIVVLILLMAMKGCFDKIAHDATDGAYGLGDSDITYSEETSIEEKIELSKYIGYTEDELIDALKVNKNDFGYYPSDDEINFICMEGELYSIRISEKHLHDKEYSLCGISIGDIVDENMFNNLSKNFDFVLSDTIDGGIRDTYINRDTGYLLGIDYNSELIVVGVGYVLENSVQ